MVSERVNLKQSKASMATPENVLSSQVLSENKHASEETMGTETKETHDQSIETWSHNDGLLTFWLLGLMTEEVMLLLDGTETAYDIWNLSRRKAPSNEQR